MSDAIPAPIPPLAPTPVPPKRASLRARALAWFARLGRGLLHGLGPGAILDKELRIQGRRVGTYWVRFAYGLLMAMFVGLTIANVFTSSFGRNSAATLSAIESLQASGPIVLIALAWMQFIGTSLAAAIFTSPLVSEERRAGTLATLLTTPLNAWQIVVGKACGALIQLLILGLMGLPVLLGVRVFGGISGELVVYTVAIVTGATIGNCALGILASTLSSRQSGAVVSAIFFTLVWYIGPPLLGAALQAGGITPPWTWFLMFSPAAGMVVLMERLSGNSTAAATPLPFWLMSLLCSLAISLVAFLLATLRLRALMREVGAGRERSSRRLSKAAHDSASASSGTLESADEAAATSDPHESLADAPMSRRERRLAQRRAKVRQHTEAREGSRVVGDAPVLWRELRQPMTTRFWVAAVGTILLALILIYAFWASDEGDGVAAVVCILGLIAAIMITCGTSGNTLGQERESRSWETLLSTPISAGQIIVGKLAGIMMRQRTILLFVLGTIIAANIGWDTRAVLLLHMSILLIASTFFVASVGLFYGCVTRRSTVAVVSTMATVLGIWLVLPVAGFMCIGMLFRSDDAASAIALTNPVTWAGIAIGGAASSRWEVSYDLFNLGKVDTVGFTFALLVFAGIYLAAGLIILTAARNSLAKSTLRGNQTDLAIPQGQATAG